MRGAAIQISATPEQRAHGLVELTDGLGRQWVMWAGDVPTFRFARDLDGRAPLDLRTPLLSVRQDMPGCDYPDCGCDLDAVCDAGLDLLERHPSKAALSRLGRG